VYSRLKGTVEGEEGEKRQLPLTVKSQGRQIISQYSTNINYYFSNRRDNHTPYTATSFPNECGL